jgi:hypothetical protein
MTSTHIEHPEDMILTGDLSVIDALYDNAFISMKMDGMSLVWGTNPANGLFFVCTKAAFNKKKIRLCYTVEDILNHFGHQIEVVDILTNCLFHLPKTDKIYWGDWLGFGHTDVLTQNTLTYVFPEVIEQKLVIAPHTVVNVYAEFSDSVCEPLTEVLEDTDMVKWVQPSVDRMPLQTKAPKINKDNIKFLSEKEAYQAKLGINALIKSGQYLDDATLTDILGCVHLANLYQYVMEIKLDMMEDMIVTDKPMSYLPDGGILVHGEGYVLHSETFGSVKLVNRSVFAYANFNNGYGT